ncbi:MAG TPA: sortase [Chloroflexota bacterium]|nr:sortase [Chloroflexota bacterium]
MNRVAGVVGSVLLLAGAVMLVYVGVSYLHQAAPRGPSWTSVQRQRGRELAGRLSGHQEVAVPAGSGVIAAGAPAVRIAIPRIAVDAPVVQTRPVAGVWNVADWAVGHLATSPNPGLPGNGAYAAHDDIKGEIFKRLDELVPGDSILLYTAHLRYRYRVVSLQTVSPSDVSVLGPTRAPTITLVTCTPYWVDSSRLIVQAIRTSRSAI